MDVALGGVLPPSWLVDHIEKFRERWYPTQRASVVGVITDGAFAQHLNHGFLPLRLGFCSYTCPVEVCSIQDLQWHADLLVATGKDFTEAYSKISSLNASE